jgi:hypothetical protein
MIAPVKLMLCPECGDLVQLRPQPRTCFCGASSGRYLDDLSTVVQSEGTASIALHNHDLRAALEALRQSPDAWHPLMVLRAYVNPRCEPDVRYAVGGAGEVEATAAGAPAGDDRVAPAQAPEP